MFELSDDTVLLLQDWGRVLLFFILIYLGIRIFKSIVVSRLDVLSKKTENEWDDTIIEILNNIRWPLYVFGSLYITLQFMVVSQRVENVVLIIFLIVLTSYITSNVYVVLKFFVSQFYKTTSNNFRIDETLLSLASGLIKLIVWLFSLLIIFQNLGFNVTALTATLLGSLGVAGIAIGFAAQSILEDVFAFFTIHVDRPFKIGDFVVIGEDNGNIEKIGVKTTRIKTLEGHELVISNKELTNVRVNNFQRMHRRRVVSVFGLTYETSKEKLVRVLEIVEQIVKDTDKAELDRVHFKEFGDFSLNYELVYFVESPDYNIYMDIQEKINFAMKEQIEKEGVEFAYPTQLVYVKNS